MKNDRFKAIFSTICCVFILGFASVSSAQTTEFSYQGFLSDNSASANGNFDFEFRLFENVNGGIAVATQPRLNVSVTNGVFSVTLDFGNFPAANRFLEIGVRPAGGGALITLAPRSKVLSTPYSTNAVNAQNAQNAQTAVNAQNATNAQNALQLGGSSANQFVLTGDARLSNARNPLPGSANYIQNGTSQQAATNFNVSGNGTAGGNLTAGIVRAETQFNIGAIAVLKSPGNFNFFAGNGAGINNTTGTGNSFFGSNAGILNTTGENNAYFGYNAGRSNTTGNSNAFFGKDAGRNATDGYNNSFFGHGAGASNDNHDNSFFGYNAGNLTTGIGNSFFGSHSGESSTTAFGNSFFGDDSGKSTTFASDNSFFGDSAGENNTVGDENTFIGKLAGEGNTSGSSNTLIGFNANVATSNLTNAVAIGANAFVEQSNSLILGSRFGVNGATVNTFVGIGTSTPQSNLHVVGRIRVSGLGSNGSTSLCHNTGGEISNCSSSLRYKTDIADFSSGLNLVNRLRPITFNWKEGGMRDFGLGAEDVAAIEPLLVTYNETGAVEGVKYDRVAIVLLNAVKEQQAQIEQQRKQLEQQQNLIESLRKIVCPNNLQAEACK